MFIRDHGKTALIYGDSEISYAELIEHVKDYSYLLKKYKKNGWLSSVKTGRNGSMHFLHHGTSALFLFSLIPCPHAKMWSIY